MNFSYTTSLKLHVIILKLRSRKYFFVCTNEAKTGKFEKQENLKKKTKATLIFFMTDHLRILLLVLSQFK